MKKIGIYPGTFDPMTNGHLNIIKRSLKIVDKLIIAVADNLNKTPLLSIKDREDIIIYDIQDIGARFYTYISTLGMVMESASKYGVKVLVLDRPNPIGGNIVEGPILDLKFQTFVGYYPIPTRYGLTIGELALMINGEKWIDGNPELEIVKIGEKNPLTSAF